MVSTPLDRYPARGVLPPAPGVAGERFASTLHVTEARRGKELEP